MSEVATLAFGAVGSVRASACFAVIGAVVIALDIHSIVGLGRDAQIGAVDWIFERTCYVVNSRGEARDAVVLLASSAGSTERVTLSTHSAISVEVGCDVGTRIHTDAKNILLGELARRTAGERELNQD